MISDVDDDVPACASPPCFMHEVDPAYMGLAAAADTEQQARECREKKPLAVANQTCPPGCDCLANRPPDAAEDISGRKVPS
jgi:hypothetical protein